MLNERSHVLRAVSEQAKRSPRGEVSGLWRKKQLADREALSSVAYLRRKIATRPIMRTRQKHPSFQLEAAHLVEQHHRCSRGHDTAPPETRWINRKRFCSKCQAPKWHFCQKPIIAAWRLQKREGYPHDRAVHIVHQCIKSGLDRPVERRQRMMQAMMHYDAPCCIVHVAVLLACTVTRRDEQDVCSGAACPHRGSPRSHAVLCVCV